MQHTHLFPRYEDYTKEFIFRVSSRFSSWNAKIKKNISILKWNLKWNQYAKYGSYLTLSVLLLIIIFVTSANVPVDYNLNEQLVPQGSVSGYVFNKHGSPIKGVKVSILEDSTSFGETNEKGFYTVGNVSGGVQSLCFNHEDYKGDTALVDLVEGVNDTLNTSILLSYGYYTLAGKVAYKGKPVPGAGVSVAGSPISAVTDEMGGYVLNKVPKNSSLKLIFAKSGIGFNTMRPMNAVSDDTTWVADIELIYKGATVSGTVFDTNGSPAGNVVVAAVGGGLVDVTDKNGNYKIRNMPVNEPTVRISALNLSGLYGATEEIDVRNNSNNKNVNIYLRPVSKENNGNSMDIKVNDIVTYDTATAKQSDDYPLIDINTYMRSYMWNLAQNLGSDNETT